jgi:hypothetical protein
MTAQIKVRVQRRAIVKFKMQVRFPANVVADPGITITRDGQTYTFALDQSVIPVVTAPTVVTANANLTTADVVVQTNQSGAIALVVPGSDSWATVNSRYGVPLSIMDISGAAATNNVTITFTGGEAASGLTSLVIRSNYGVLRLMPKSGGGWVAF